MCVDPVLRERSRGAHEITPAEFLAVLEPKKHGVPQERLVAHLEALSFILFCSAYDGHRGVQRAP